LREFQKEHGNIEVRVTGEDEHWGTTYNAVDEDSLMVRDETSLCPRIQEGMKAVIFCYES